MDSLNTILNSGQYGAAVERHNDNYGKIQQALTRLENVALDPLTIKKTYATLTDAGADTNPVGDDGVAIKIGQIVSVTSENKIYKLKTLTSGVPTWEEVGTIGNLSAYTLSGGSAKTLLQVDMEKIDAVSSLNQYLQSTQGQRKYERNYLRITTAHNVSYKFQPSNTNLGTSKYADELITYAACIVPDEHQYYNGNPRPCAIKRIGFENNKYFVEFVLKRLNSGYTDFTGWLFKVEKDNPFNLIGEKVKATDNGVEIEVELFLMANWNLMKNFHYYSNIMNTGQIIRTLGYGQILNTTTSDILNQISAINGTATDYVNEIKFSTSQVVSSINDWNGSEILLAATLNLTNITIYQNGSSIGTIAASKSISGLSSIVVGNTLHILISIDQYVNASTRDRGIEYYTYDLSTKTQSSLLQTILAGTVLYGVGKMCVFGGSVYAPVYYLSPLGSTYQAVDGKVYLYKLNTIFDQVSIIAQSNEVWGVRFTDTENVVQQTIDSMNPHTTNLNTDGTHIYATISSVAANNVGVNYVLFEKRTSDGLTWEQYGVESKMKSKSVDLVKINGNDYLIGGRVISYQGWSRLIISKRHSNVFGYAGGKNNSLTSYSMTETGDYFRISEVFSVSSTYYIQTFKLLKSDLIERVNVNKKRNRGTVGPDYVPTDLLIGDYFRIEEKGTYQNMVSSVYPFSLSNQTLYITLAAGEVAEAVWTGFHFVKNLIYDKGVGIKKVNVFYPYFYRNQLISNAFRCAIVDKSISGTLLAFTDIRYVDPDDYGMHQIGVARSVDEGLTWKDYKIAIPRGGEDSVLSVASVVDRAKSSSQYGRIWLLCYSTKIGNPTKTWLNYSDDDGLTWSAPQDISSLFPDKKNAPGAQSAGITLSNGTLILPVYYSTIAGPYAKAGFIYKPLLGSWTLGKFAQDGSNENQIIEQKNGKLLMNTRMASGGTRGVYELDNLTSEWIRRTDLEVLQDIIGGCNAGFVRYRDTYIFSQPTRYDTSKRWDIKVFYSYDLINWHELVQLTDVESGGYSSIICDDSTFGVIYEATAIGRIDYANLNYLRNILR